MVADLLQILFQDVQVIMDETFGDDSNINKNGGNIVGGVELIGKYRFEYFARNIQGYYYEVRYL